MSNRWILIIIAIILVVIFVFKKQSDNLIGPDFSITTPSPTTPRIKQYQFNSSTDLKKELESISPQVLDSDFEEKR